MGARRVLHYTVQTCCAADTLGIGSDLPRGSPEPQTSPVPISRRSRRPSGRSAASLLRRGPAPILGENDPSWARCLDARLEEANQPMAHRITDECLACAACIDECPEEAISEGDPIYVIDPKLCTDCGTCVDSCPNDAIAAD
jgi:ferredoxin